MPNWCMVLFFNILGVSKIEHFFNNTRLSASFGYFPNIQEIKKSSTMNISNESIVFNQMHKLGSTLHEKGIFFRVWAPNAENVFLTGTFNNWDSFNTSMLPQDDGSWSVNVDNSKAKIKSE